MPYARYAGYSGTDPAQYAMGQQGRQDEQFRNLINMMIALSKWKTEQGQYSQEWQNKLSEQAAARDIEKQRTEAYKESVKPKPAQTTEWQAKLNAAMQHFKDDPKGLYEWFLNIAPKKTLKEIRDEARARAEGAGGGGPLKETSNIALPPQIRGTTQLSAGGTTPPPPPAMPPPSQRTRKNELSAAISDDGKTIIFSGKKYKINPDGTVTIDGKQYQIR